MKGGKRSRKKLTGADYEKWIQNEVVGCKELLEQRLGIKVNCFAVPFGNYNEQVKELARNAGYDAMFTVYGQPITFTSPMDAIGRYAIEANKPKVFADAVNMIGASSGGGTAVAEVGAKDLTTQPADGDTVRTALPLIKANLSSVGQIEPGSVQMRVSGLGLVPANFDPKTGTVSYQVPQKLREKTCTVIVSAKSEGKKVETHWTFGIDEAAAATLQARPRQPLKSNREPKGRGFWSPGALGSRPLFMFSQLSDKLQDIFKDLRGHGVISEANVDAALRQVRLALLEADVDFQVARKFIARVKEKALGESVLRSVTPGQQIVKIFHDELTMLLGGDAEPLRLEDQTRILIVGFNGSGKTTSSAKLALLLKKQGRLPSLIACDLQRPAAIEQLATLGKQIDVPVHVPDPGEKNVQRVATAALEMDANNSGAWCADLRYGGATGNRRSPDGGTQGAARNF